MKVVSMKIPRLTKSIFLDQFLYMQAVGVLIGLAFPYFLSWYGFPADQVHNWRFHLISQIAGQTVGLISFFLISMVIRPHLKQLSSKMENIAQGLEQKDFLAHTSDCADNLCQMTVVSKDEIGVSAQAYNQLLGALIQSHEYESVYTRFSHVISESLDAKKLSEDTVQLLIESTKIEAAAILLFQQGDIWLEAVQGIKEPEALIENESVIKAIKSGQDKMLTLPKNVQLDGVLTFFTPSEIFVKPIEYKGVQLGGMIAATGSELADDRTLNTLDLFTRNMGLALNNALIHSKFQKLAAYDALTNVYNRRFGMARLKEDFARVNREKSSLSLIMLDIDHFKQVNDTYGHLVGDKAIILIADILKNASRDGDIVIRYGGEEFLMILPGASVKNSKAIAERIRHQVMDSEIKEGEQTIHLTISAGISAYPDATTVDEIQLIDKADQALYQAKHSGRNKVIVFGETS